MSVYKATSWGRTRRPKGLKSLSVPGSKETATTVTSTTASADLMADLDSIEYPQLNGYVTENQRYLHVLVKHGSGQKSVKVYGYNYNFGEWAVIMVHDGDGTYSEMTATAGTSGEAQQYIFDISGIDRVAFVSADAPSAIKAACSSF